ncbi:MAG: hypothetical protein RSG52_13160 [Terrisporobacter sp.]|uniref:hypothetical protein n=1 Tax=Terrisporobacter sp. TaxID=1965305 RepID=UPI002FC63243
MSKFEFNNNCNCSSESTVAVGNSLEVDVNYCESEVRADVVVSEYNSVRLWGRILNCDGRAVSNALVKLLKVEHCGKEVTYKGISHTISDCEGFYQFELCGNHDEKDCYKILVSKSANGPERIIPLSKGSCDPCCDNSFDPCKEYNPIISQQQSCPPSCEQPSYDCGCAPNYYQKPRY